MPSCSACGRDDQFFSNAQLKKKATSRRCMDCTESSSSHDAHSQSSSRAAQAACPPPSGESGGAFLSCACEAVQLSIPADCKAILRFECCCCDCRKGLGVHSGNGAPRPPAVPDLVYYPNVLMATEGREHLRCFQLQEGYPTRRLVAACCWTVLAADHPGCAGRRFVVYNGPAKLRAMGTSVNGRSPLRPADDRIFQDDMTAAELATLPPFCPPAASGRATWASSDAEAAAALARVQSFSGTPKYSMWRLETIQQIIDSLPTGVEVADPAHTGPTPLWMK